MTDSNPKAADQTAESDNLSVEELLAQGVFGSPQATDEEPEAEEPEPEEPEEEVEETETEEPDEQTEAEDESDAGIDLDSLSEEQVSALAEKLRSKAIARYGQLTKRAKEAEEKLAQLQASPTTPTVKPIDDNPFRELTSLDAIAAKREELEGVIEATDQLLDDNDDLGNDDVINFKGAEFTKRQLKAAQRNARKGLDKFLPAQEAAVKEAEQVKALAAHVEGMVEERFGEFLADEAVAARHKSVLDDPEVQRAMKASPKLAAQLPWIVAHYMRSLIMDEEKTTKPAKKTVSPTGGAAPKIKPPISPGSVGAPTSKPAGDAKKKATLRQQFEESGSVEDLTRFLAGA